MAYGNWYPFLGGFVFWVGLVVAIILYAVKRKWHPIMYLISVSLYIFTIGFVIDVFDLGKNTIMFLLALSALVMMGVGYYLARRKPNDTKAPGKPEEQSESEKLRAQVVGRQKGAARAFKGKR